MKKQPSSFSVAPTYFLSSGVQREDLSLQSPFHSNFPQGFQIWSNLTCYPFDLTSNVPIREYAWSFTRPFYSFSTPAVMIQFHLSASIILSMRSFVSFTYHWIVGAPVMYWSPTHFYPPHMQSYHLWSFAKAFSIIETHNSEPLGVSASAKHSFSGSYGR